MTTITVDITRVLATSHSALALLIAAACFRAAMASTAHNVFVRRGALEVTAMTREDVILISAATIACAAMIFTVVRMALAQSREQTPVTVEMTATYYEYPSGRLVKNENLTVAIRADGSRVDAPGTGNQRIVLDIRLRKRVSIDNLTRSLTSYALSDKAVRELTRPFRACPDEHNAQRSVLLGYDVVKFVKVLGDARVESWLAPALNCLELKYTVFRGVDRGQGMPATIVEAKSVVVGEPDATLFAVPSDYSERSPSQVIAEHDRLYGADGEPNCRPDRTKSLQTLDKVYSYHSYHKEPAAGK